MVHQEAWLYASLPGPKEPVSHRFAAGRRGYPHLVDGMLEINDFVLNAGDAAKIETEQGIVITAKMDSGLLRFGLG